jgi:hypothetical protein
MKYDIINPMEANIKLYGFTKESYKEINVAKLPIIGWYAKKQLGIIIITIIIIILFYFIFIKQQNDTNSTGCNRNGCYATNCIGPKCKGDNCVGIGCHAGSCYGEECNGGTCEGTGCKGGDCYGANCKVGNCVDPNCPNDKEQQGLCKPRCDWGRAYNLPSYDEPVKTIKKMLPFNTIFNKNYCNKPSYITENLVKDDKTLYNFSVVGANYYHGGYSSLKEIQNKVAKGSVIDDTKGLIRYNDPIINTDPNIYKNWNCVWETKFNDKEISAKLIYNYNNTNINNVNRYDYIWSQIKTPVLVLDSKGNETMCPALLNMSGHIFTNINYYLDIEQLKDILGIQTLNARMSQIMALENMYYNNDYDGIRAYMSTIDFFQDKITIDNIINNISNYSNKISLYEKIENIRGTIMTSNCNNCGQLGTRTLSNDKLPCDVFGNILPCKERVYIYDKIVQNFDPSATIDKSSVSYKLIKMKFANNDTFTFNDKEEFINLLHSVKNNHLMFYYDTDIKNKTMKFVCFFCGKFSYLKLNKLITSNTSVNNNGVSYSLGNCVKQDDFNHYMYEVLDNNQNVYYKCLKCFKSTQ